jgi:signal transduction histidine kinase
VNILKHAVVSSPSGENISMTTELSDDQVVLKIAHRLKHLSDDDLEQFFFPHIEQKLEESVLDLPLSKIIIHRHGGKIDLLIKDNNLLEITITFTHHA